MKPTVAVLGAGRLGQAVARILAGGGTPTRVWARDAKAARALHKSLGNGAALEVSSSVAEACADAAVVFFAVPAGGQREVAAAFGEVARGDHVVLHAIRGVEPGFVLPHRILREETCVRKIGVLGGPLHAQELTSGRTLALVLASRFAETGAVVRRLTEGGALKVHESRDVVGVEVAGIVSHVSALAVGMAEGLDLGETARGVLLTRGLVESTRLGVALGGDPATFSGLAGVGDLIPRSVTATRRHHEVGAAVAQGTPLEDALNDVAGEVEGVTTAREATHLAERRGLELPLLTTVHAVLQGVAPARESLEALLQLDLDLGRGLAAP